MRLRRKVRTQRFSGFRSRHAESGGGLRNFLNGSQQRQMVLPHFRFELRCRSQGVNAPLCRGSRVGPAARLSTSDTAAKPVLSSRRAEPKTRAIPRGGATLERRPRFQSCTEAAMPERRRTRRRVAGIFVGAVIITATVFGFNWGTSARAVMVREDRLRRLHQREEPSGRSKQGSSGGDTRALAFIQERVYGQIRHDPSGPRRSTSQGVGRDLSCLRAAFPRFAAAARSTTIAVACRIFDRFAVEPAPAQWVDTLRPLHDLLSAALADVDPAAPVHGLGRDQPALGLDSRPIDDACRGADTR